MIRQKLERDDDRDHHTLARGGLLASFVLAAALVLCATTAFAQGQPGYVDTTALNLRAGPGTDSAIVGILLRYDAVTVMGTEQVGRTLWYEIEAGGGYTNGFVAARYVQFGDTPPGAVQDGVSDYGTNETPTLERGRHQYVGPGVCAECHSESTGNYHQGAYAVWAGTVHSAAYETLAKDYTLEIAQRKRGIDDPQNDWRCLKCHTTAWGAEPDQLAPSYSHAQGVGCEVCHGPGGSYAEEDHGPGNPDRAALGFRILTNLTERREVCESCHNPTSPTYKPFNLREFSRSIAHWVDPGDEFYYEDAVAEANRRQKRVDRRREEAVTSAALKSEKKEKKKSSDAAARKQREAAERKRLAEQERRERDRERREAEQALAQAEAEAAAEREAQLKARAAAEKQALASAKKAKGVEVFLQDVDEIIMLNTKGVKNNPVEFPHLAHASKQYLPNGTCNDCHHTHDDPRESPEACSTCHEIDGDAGETKAKTNATHQRKKGFPRAPGVEETSCVGCHKSMNAQLNSGKRDGRPAPTKCVACHTKKR